MTIEELAYLRCPDKVRAALINTTGKAPSRYAIEARLRAIQKRPMTEYGKPDGNEGVQYRIVPEGSRDPLLEALRREHPERFPPVSYRPRSEW